MDNQGRPNKLVWIGRVLTVLVVLPFVFSIFAKMTKSPEMMQGWNHLGWPETMISVIAILEVVSLAFYIVPGSSVLGAILLTGYLGGAISTHLRIGEGVGAQVAFGIAVWLGLFLREPRLKELLPLRK